MNPTWGVYTVRGRLAGGAETEAKDRKAVSYFIRWRVNGGMRRRSFETRGYANTFRDELLKAKLLGWQADDKGWPIDPSRPDPAAPPGPGPTRPSVALSAHTVESYVTRVWWPTIRTTLEDKNRLGHKRNADLAIHLLRLGPDDPRVAAGLGQHGDSIRLTDLTSDDIRAALVARRGINGRTAAVNQRRLAKTLAELRSVCSWANTRYPLAATAADRAADNASVDRCLRPLDSLEGQVTKAGHSSLLSPHR